MSHQLSATHLVYRLTGSLSAPRTRKIGTLSATGLMPALLAACGSSSAPAVDIGTAVPSASAFLITGNSLGRFGAQISAYDPDGDGPNEIVVNAEGTIYVSKLPTTDLANNNYHSVTEFNGSNANGWQYTGGEVPKMAFGDLNGDGFDDIVIGESLKSVQYRTGFVYVDAAGNVVDTPTSNDSVAGNITAASTGRVILIFGTPNSVLGTGALDFNVGLGSYPTAVYTDPFTFTADAPSTTLVGGRISGLGREVAIGNVLQGDSFTGPELIIFSSGRAADTAAGTHPNEGARISIINNSQFSRGTSHLADSQEVLATVARDSGDVVFGNTFTQWSIFTGTFNTAAQENTISRETADSPLAIEDINGDGISDIIVGRYPSTGSSSNFWTGEVNVVFGRATTTTSTDNVFLHQDSWENDGTTNNVFGFTVDGFPTGTDPRDRAFAGASVAGADINGDGIKDLIIGAPGNTQEFNSGQVYVIYGKASGLVNIDVSPPTPGNQEWHQGNTLGFEIKFADPTGGDGFGVLGAGNLGASVSSAGDFNNDGIEDLIIGAPTFSPSQALARGGASYIIFGRHSSSETDALKGSFSSNVLLDQANWSNGGVYGFQITSSEADARMGVVSTVGDVNGDNIDDVGISAINGGSGGAAFAIYGADLDAFGDLSVGAPAFARVRDGVSVDADGVPITTTSVVPAVVPAALTADSFFDVG